MDFIIENINFPLSQELINSYKNTLNTYGLLVIKNPICEDACKAAQSKALEAYVQDIFPQLPQEDQNNIQKILDNKNLTNIEKLHKITSNPNYWKSGIIGNKSFGYLFCQPESISNSQFVEIDGNTKVFVAPGSGFQANLSLLTHPSSANILDLLMELTDNQLGMISQDSCKIHRGDLTIPHTDIYSDTDEKINRNQAMFIGPTEGNIKLCFVAKSNQDPLKTQIIEKIDKDIYSTSGFQRIPTDKFSEISELIFDNVYFGKANDLIIWKPGIIHFEANHSKSTKSLSFAKDTKSKTERYIIGTQTPHKITQSQLKDIGFYAQKGFIYHPYNNLNSNNAIGKNSVHLKRTQYKRAREVPQSEKDKLQKATEELKRLKKDDKLNDFFENLGPQTKKVYGIN